MQELQLKATGHTGGYWEERASIYFVGPLAALKPQAEGGVESEESRRGEQCITDLSSVPWYP